MTSMAFPGMASRQAATYALASYTLAPSRMARGEMASSQMTPYKRATCGAALTAAAFHQTGGFGAE
jgi:hypothetical protein